MEVRRALEMMGMYRERRRMVRVRVCVRAWWSAVRELWGGVSKVWGRGREGGCLHP